MLDGTSHGKRLLEIHNSRWNNIINMGLRPIDCENGSWNELA